MGTRSLTIIHTDDDEEELLKIYGQFDGYIYGHGYDLARILSKRKIVNGYTFGDIENNAFNGMGCLAAQVVSDLKKEIGGYYIIGSETDISFIDYVYHVYGSPGSNEALIEVFSYGEMIFSGSASELLLIEE